MNAITPRPRYVVGAFADLLPKPEPMIAILTRAISELNTAPGTATDEQQARALQRILARRGLTISVFPPVADATSGKQVYSALADRVETSATTTLGEQLRAVGEGL